MFKKVLSMFAVVVALIAVFAVTARAVSYWEEDFSSFDPATDFASMSATSTDYSRVVDGEALKIANEAVSGDVNQSLSFTLNSDAGDDVVFQYDIKFTQIGGTYTSCINVGGESNKRSVTKMTNSYTSYGEDEAGKIVESIETDKWYTYVYQFKKGSDGAINGLDIFRKLTSASGQPAQIASLTAEQITGTSENFTYDICVGAGVTVYLDNISCYSGNSVNAQFKLGDVVLEDTGDLASGTIKIEAEIVCGELSFDTETPKKIKLRKINPVYVAFDSEGRMVACKTLTAAQVYYGKYNKTYTLNDATAKGALAKDGYLGFYVLEDPLNRFRAFASPVELTAAE